MQCSSAVLPQAKIILGLFLLIFSFLPRSGISAILHHRSAEHNYGRASEELATSRAWITRQYWISNMVNKILVGWKSQYAKPWRKWGLGDLWGLRNMLWMLLIQDCLGNRDCWYDKLSWSLLKFLCFPYLFHNFGSEEIEGLHLAHYDVFRCNKILHII